MPISIYSIVHIGANNQLGGLKKGFSSVEYHELIALAVANPAPNPTSNVSAKDKNSFTEGLTVFI